MKIHKILSSILVLLILTVSLYSQDRRTLDTKVADLLALLPASDLSYTDKLMNDMLNLGEEGIKKICDQIIPAGTGDDTQARFAVESFSRFLSQPGKEFEKKMWEEICIQYVTTKKDNTVKDFFMKQLQLVGSEKAIEALKSLFNDKINCEPAIAVAVSIGGKYAEDALSAALKNRDLPCPATVMNALSKMQSQNAVEDFIFWSGSPNAEIKAASYNALAQSGDPRAYPLLLRAAKNANYKWDKLESVNALLNFANRAGEKGDIKTAGAVSKTLVAKCKDKSNMHYKTAALSTYVNFHGYNAMPLLLKAAKDQDTKYRNSAIRMSLAFPEKEAVNDWARFFPKAPSYAKPDIITYFGIRKDKQALATVKSALENSDIKIRKEAVISLASIEGKNAIGDLIDYMLKNSSIEDQTTVKTALMSITGRDKMDQFILVLKDGSPAAKQSAIEMLAWGNAQEYFNEVLPYTESDNEAVKNAAFKSLAELAGPNDQDKLIKLISSISNKDHITAVQEAIQASANQIPDPEIRSASILKSLSSQSNKEKLIPVLSKTGGEEALQTVLKEFQEGSPSLHDICFKALSEWKDYTASSALFKILESGNKTYESQAFSGYIRQIRSARVADEQKLLLFRKILPYASTAARKNSILNELGKLKTYQTLFIVANYFDDSETSAAAARAAMTIALPSDDSKAGMYGNMVRNILNKAIPLIQGPESDYEKEMIIKYLASMPPDEGFYPMFNGKDLTGWQGLVENPVSRAKMKPQELAKKQLEADKRVPDNWSVKDGCIWFNGRGQNLCSVKDYADFEMLVDWRISRKGDSGIYLRGSPQVQIWDISRVESGAQVGSGGLYNNKTHESDPLKVADNPIDEWNTFRIIMIGERVTVWLNGELVVDNVIMENYWDRSIPIFPTGPIELQAHGTDLAFRDIYVREISEEEYNLSSEEKAEGFVSLFNGRNLDNWTGNKTAYVVEDNMIVIRPEKGSGGNLFTEKEYADFIFRFEFQLTPGANNGLGIRAPLSGDAAYMGMEIQILDDTAPVYANLQEYQYHGSVYGVIPAKRGSLKPVGEWNYQEVIARGTHIKVILNGTVIVDGDIAGPRDSGTLDKRDHPGLHNKSGHIGFLGHGSVVKFKNIRLKEIKD